MSSLEEEHEGNKDCSLVSDSAIAFLGFSFVFFLAGRNFYINKKFPLTYFVEPPEWTHYILFSIAALFLALFVGSILKRKK